MSDLTVALSGSITSQPASGSTISAGSRTLTLGLQALTKAAQTSIGQQSYLVSSVTNEVLGFPVTFSARLFALRIIDSGSLAVRVTNAGAGQVIHQTSGLLILEVNAAEQITAVDVTGSAEFEWLATGINT